MCLSCLSCLVRTILPKTPMVGWCGPPGLQKFEILFSIWLSHDQGFYFHKLSFEILESAWDGDASTYQVCLPASGSQRDIIAGREAIFDENRWFWPGILRLSMIFVSNHGTFCFYLSSKPINFIKICFKKPVQHGISRGEKIWFYLILFYSLDFIGPGKFSRKILRFRVFRGLRARLQHKNRKKK